MIETAVSKFKCHLKKEMPLIFLPVKITFISFYALFSTNSYVGIYREVSLQKLIIPQRRVRPFHNQSNHPASSLLHFY